MRKTAPLRATAFRTSSVSRAWSSKGLRRVWTRPWSLSTSTRSQINGLKRRWLSLRRSYTWRWARSTSGCGTATSQTTTTTPRSARPFSKETAQSPSSLSSAVPESKQSHSSKSLSDHQYITNQFSSSLLAAFLAEGSKLLTLKYPTFNNSFEPISNLWAYPYSSNQCLPSIRFHPWKVSRHQLETKRHCFHCL